MRFNPCCIGLVIAAGHGRSLKTNSSFQEFNHEIVVERSSECFNTIGLLIRT